MAQLHSLLIANHRPYAAIYADPTARLAATGFVRALGGGTVAFTAEDLYKKALQLDDASEWVLTAITPTWVQVSGAGSLASDSLTNALLANMAQATIKGRASGAGTGDPTDLTATQATVILNAVVGDSGSGGTKGLVPAPAAGDAAAGKFLKADGSFAVPDVGAANIAPLVIESANVVAQRNGANAQSLLIYRTFTDASNYERLRLEGIAGGSGEFEISSEKAGTGTQRDLRLKRGSAFLTYSGTGLYPETTNAQDLGITSLQWNNVYAKDIQTLGGDVWLGRLTRLADDSPGLGGLMRIKDVFGNGASWTGGSGTPAQITSDQNNYDPGSYAYLQRWSSDASRNVTGYARSPKDGETHLIVNVGAQNIVLKHEDAGSTDVNRFLSSTGADITLGPNQAAESIYDGTTQRRRVFKKN